MSTHGDELRLLWAICHPTLVRTEVPILNQSGFSVDIQDPLAEQMRPIEVVEYPTIEELLPNQRLNAERYEKLGPRARLNLRTRPFSKAEFEQLNDEYDAVMIATSLHRALNVAKGFRGTILFRDYGRLPGRQVPRRRPPRRPPDSLVHVPIFSSISPPCSRAAIPSMPLLTLPPEWPAVQRKDSNSAQGPVSIFAASLSDEPWFEGWLERMVEVASDREVRVFGTPETSRAAIERKCAVWMPRMADKVYIRTFEESSVWIYPYSDPTHSHYIPMEAINLNTPCLMPKTTAVPFESRAITGRDFRKYGLVGTVDELVGELQCLMLDPDYGARIAARQKQLMRPFSAENIGQQGEKLAQYVRKVSTRTEYSSVRPLNKRSTGPPSGQKYLKALRDPNGIGSCRISAATLASPYWIRQDLDVDFKETGQYAEVQLRAGEDTRLALAAPAFSSRRSGLFKVEVEVAGTESPPLVVEVSKGGPPVRIVEMTAAGPSTCGSWVRYAAEVHIQPEDGLSVRVINALASRRTKIRDVVIDEGQRNRSETSPMDDSIPSKVRVWVTMHPHPWNRRLQRILATRVAIMRIDTTSPALRQWSGQRIALTDRRRRAFRFVVSRSGNSFRLVLAPWPLARFSTKSLSISGRESVVAVGTRASLMGLELTVEDVVTE